MSRACRGETAAKAEEAVEKKVAQLVFGRVPAQTRTSRRRGKPEVKVLYFCSLFEAEEDGGKIVMSAEQPYTAEQYAEARRRVRTYNRAIARTIQTHDQKALVSAIQELEGWSEGVAENRGTWVQAVWHADHETERVGAMASAAFHAFRPELLAQLHNPNRGQ